MNISKHSPVNAAPIQRRDASGHLDPAYAQRLRARSGKSTNSAGDDAFLHGVRGHEELAARMGEGFVAAATSGEPIQRGQDDELSEAEQGGPYLITSDEQEFADGTDESNPQDATREPFPTT